MGKIDNPGCYIQIDLQGTSPKGKDKFEFYEDKGDNNQINKKTVFFSNILTHVFEDIMENSIIMKISKRNTYNLLLKTVI